MVDKAYEFLPTQRSRELRNNPTRAERHIWNALSNRQLGGVRFNRQVVIRPYICDLVARSARLIIEIDGGQHGDSIGYDDARTAFLEAKGYRVIRFWNNDVLRNIEGVVETISQALGNLPSRQSGRGRDTEGGEGEGLSSFENDMPSPPRLRRSPPPAPAGGAQSA